MTDGTAAPEDGKLLQESPAESDILASDKATADDKSERTGEGPPSEGVPPEPSEEEGREEVLPGFSTPASKLFYVQLNKYLVDLERLSRFKAKQGSVDGVSSQHVREAAGFLSVSRITSRFSRTCETIGGIVLGGGISELITILQDKAYSGRLILLTAFLIAGGAAMIGIFLGRD